MDEMFGWNWLSYPTATSYFWFDRDSGGACGYYMSTSPEIFIPWDEDKARSRLHEFVKHSPKLGPFLSEIPPIILKIRTMEQRHKRYLERKNYD